MPSFSSLPVFGYRELPVANTFIRQERATEHLGIVLPGLGDSAGMPVCYYPGLVLRDLGADLLNVEYTYTRTDFPSLSEEEQIGWLRADVGAAVQAGLAQRRYRRVTLVGKSIGTLAMAALFAARPALPVSECIWLTPVLRSATVREAIARGGQRSMLAIGAADSYYRPELIPDLERGLDRKALVIPNADHSLEIAGDPLASLKAMELLVQEIVSFLK